MGVSRSLKYAFRKHHVIGMVVIIVALATASGAVYASLGGLPKNAASGDIELQKGLVGWWKMDGNAKDATPYANNGTATSTTADTDRTGKASSSLLFNGSSSYIDTNQTYALDVFTASIWVYNTAASGSYKTAMGNTRDCCGSGYRGFEIDTSYTTNNGRIIIWNGGASAAASATGGTTPVSGWTHYVGTYDGTTLRFYQDGAQVGSSTSYSGTLGTPTTTLKLGRTGAVAAGFFTGKLDDARLYNRALSTNEVSALYKSYNPGLSAASGENGLLAQWKMDGNAKDSSPYGYNGTVSSASLTTDREGKANSAYSFNGSNAYIGAPTISVSGSVSVSAWVYSTNFSQNGFIVGKNTVNTQWELFFEGPLLRWRGGSTDNFSCAAPSNSTWHHVAATQTGTTAKIYIDGVQCNSGTATAIGNSAGVVEIGRFNSGYYFTGSIDDARVYSRVLTATEIASMSKSYNSSVTVSNLQKGLVVNMGFNGNSKDATPYANNGTNTSVTLTTDRKGRANSAYSFNGTSSNIAITNVSSLSIGQPGLTLSAWVKLNTMTTTSAIINKNAPYLMWVDNTGAVFTGLYKSSAWSFVTSAAGVITTGVWKHIAVTYNGTSRILYINGAQQGSPDTSISGNIDIFSSGISIGYDNCCARYYVDGSLDDIRIYNRALSAAEVLALYGEYK